MHQQDDYFGFVRNSDFREKLTQKGKSVYSIWWDSGAPGGGADVESIWKMEGSYFVTLSSEDYAIGPFDILTGAIKATEMDFIMSAVTDINCTEMGDVDLAPLLRSPNDTGFRVNINGACWQLNELRQFVTCRDNRVSAHEI